MAATANLFDLLGDGDDVDVQALAAKAPAVKKEEPAAAPSAKPAPAERKPAGGEHSRASAASCHRRCAIAWPLQGGCCADPCCSSARRRCTHPTCVLPCAQRPRGAPRAAVAAVVAAVARAVVAAEARVAVGAVALARREIAQAELARRGWPRRAAAMAAGAGAVAPVAVPAEVDAAAVEARRWMATALPAGSTSAATALGAGESSETNSSIGAQRIDAAGVTPLALSSGR